MITCVALATEVEYEIFFPLRRDRFAQFRPVAGVLRNHGAVFLQEAVLGVEASQDVIAHSAERRSSSAREGVHHLDIAKMMRNGINWK